MDFKLFKLSSIEFYILAIVLLAPIVASSSPSSDKLVEEVEYLFVPNNISNEIKVPFLHTAGMTIRHTKRFGDKKIFSVVVTHSPIGFRIYPDIPPRKSYKSHLIFGGCSLTYGEGVSDQKTFPYLFANKYPDVNIVNMGIRGAATYEHMYLLEKIDWTKKIKEEDGIYVFTIFSGHFERVNHDYSFFDWAGNWFPYYDDSGDRPVYKGSIKDNARYKFYQFLKKYKLDYPWLRLTALFSSRFDSLFEERFVKQIAFIKSLYLKQFPKGRFVVSFMPDKYVSYTQESTNKMLKLMKEKYDIEFLDHEYHEPKEGEIYSFPIDGHPTELSNKVYFEQLSQQLKL